MCCVCNGSCNHVGYHSFCAAHGGSGTIGPVITSTTTNYGVGPDMLAAALAALLDDTQHAAHRCGDSECPVDYARQVLAAYRSTQIVWSYT